MRAFGCTTVTAASVSHDRSIDIPGVLEQVLLATAAGLVLGAAVTAAVEMALWASSKTDLNVTDILKDAKSFKLQATFQGTPSELTGTYPQIKCGHRCQ